MVRQSPDKSLPPPATDLSVPLSDLPAWIARHAMNSNDGGAVVTGIGQSLVAAGVPVRLVGFGTRSLSAVHLGFLLAWRPGSEIEQVFASHGDVTIEHSTIVAALEAGQSFVRWDLAHGEGCAALPEMARLRAEDCTEYLLDIVGLPPGTALHGVGLFYATDRPGGFTDADVAALRNLREAFSLAVLNFTLSHALTNLLDAYVGARTRPLVLNGRIRRGEGELISAAILLADLKRFTDLADREDPQRLVGWLDEHLAAPGLEVSALTVPHMWLAHPLGRLRAIET